MKLTLNMDQIYFSEMFRQIWDKILISIVKKWLLYRSI